MFLQEKPEPVEIDVQELLAKVKKPEKKTVKKIHKGSATIETRSNLLTRQPLKHFLTKYFCFQSVQLKFSAISQAGPQSDRVEESLNQKMLMLNCVPIWFMHLHH